MARLKQSRPDSSLDFRPDSGLEFQVKVLDFQVKVLDFQVEVPDFQVKVPVPTLSSADSSMALRVLEMSCENI